MGAVDPVPSGMGGEGGVVILMKKISKNPPL